MPFRGDIGKEVTRGTICVDHWNVSVTLMCADSIPVGEASPLFVEIKWRRVQDASLEPGRPEDAMPVVLSFRKQTSAASGDIHFNSADGPTLRGFSTDICQLLWIYGQAQTAGAAPDVLLEVKIEDELRGSLPLMVKPVERQITIRAEDPAKPAPVIPPAEEALKLKAVVTPATAGRFQWASVSPNLLELKGALNTELIQVVAHGSLAVERYLAVLFTPDDGGPSIMAVHHFEAGREVFARIDRAAGDPPARLEFGWVYIRINEAISTAYTNHEGKLFAAPRTADRSSPWLYTQPFYLPVNKEFEFYYSRGKKPVPVQVLEARQQVFFRRRTTVPPNEEATAPINLVFPEIIIRLTRPKELTIWPLLWEVPDDEYMQSGFNQGNGLYDAGGNLTVQDGNPTNPPQAGDRLRERGLRVEGSIDARATGARIQVVDVNGATLQLRQGIDPTLPAVDEIPLTLQPPAGNVRGFEGDVFFANAAGAFGPVQILIRSEGFQPPTLECFAMQFCGCQIALVDDFITNMDGQSPGPRHNEADDHIVVDFKRSPMATPAALAGEARCRRMVIYRIQNQSRLIDLSRAPAADNPLVLRPQMPLWMAEFQILGMNRDRLQNWMAHRHYARNAGVLVGPPAPVGLRLELSWRMVLSWDGPDSNSPGHPITRPNQVYSYRAEFDNNQTLAVHFRDGGQTINPDNGRDTQIAPDGEIQRAFNPSPIRVPHPVPNRRLPKLLVTIPGQPAANYSRPWGRQAGAPQVEALIIEFQPRIEIGGREAIRGGECELRLRSIQIDGDPIDLGLVPDNLGQLAPPPAADPAIRIPVARVIGTNPVPHADIEALVNALVEQGFNARPANDPARLLTLAVWQITARRIFAHEVPNDSQFETRVATRYNFNGVRYGLEQNMPLFGPPHGYGFGQLDLIFGRGANDDEIWSFLENIRSAVRLILEEKAAAALFYLRDQNAGFADPLNTATDRERAVFRREVVRRYNGGREFIWSVGDWRIRPVFQIGDPQWEDALDHTQGPRRSLRYPDRVLGTRIEYYTPYPAGNLAATVFNWPINFPAAQYGPGIP